MTVTGLILPALPESLAGKRVLYLAPAGESDRLATELEGRGAAPHLRRAANEDWGESGFDLTICHGVLNRDLHPASLLAKVWQAMAEGGTLLLHSLVAAEVERSRFASFAAAGGGADSIEWLPGRLALRWSLETSGFDVDRWLETGEGVESGLTTVALQAVRTARWPSLIQATPAKPEGLTDVPG